MRKEYQKPVVERVSFQMEDALNNNANTSDIGGGGFDSGAIPWSIKPGSSTYNFDGEDKAY